MFHNNTLKWINGPPRMLRLISYEFSVWLPNGINTGNGCSYLNLEFIEMSYIHVIPHSSPQWESILVIITVVFISDFFGFYIDVNLESGCHIVLILATIAIICSCLLIIILVVCKRELILAVNEFQNLLGCIGFMWILFIFAKWN